jgi:hypothetical protein
LTYSARSPGNIRSVGEIEGGGANILEAPDIYSKAYLEFRDTTQAAAKGALIAQLFTHLQNFAAENLFWSLVSPSRAVPREAIIERRGKIEQPPLISGVRYTGTANTDGIHDDQTRDGISPPC